MGGQLPGVGARERQAALPRQLPLAGTELLVEGQQEVVEARRQVAFRVERGRRLVDRWIGRDHLGHGVTFRENSNRGRSLTEARVGLPPGG